MLQTNDRGDIFVQPNEPNHTYIERDGSTIPSITIDTDIWTPVPLTDTLIEVNPNGYWDASAPTILTCLIAGAHILGGHAQLASGGGFWFGLRIVIGGSVIIGPVSNYIRAALSSNRIAMQTQPRLLATGDTIQLQIKHKRGSGLNLQGAVLWASQVR